MGESFTNDFRRFFLRGLAAVLPTLLTLAIIIYVFRFVQDNIGKHINKGGVYLAARVWTERTYPENHPEDFQTFFNQKYNAIHGTWDTYLWWVGFVLAVTAIYVFGRFVASFMGRGIWGVVDQTLFKLPIVKQIYPYIKQVTDFLLSEKKLEFSRVVAIEYPRKGVWSMGLVTGPGLRTLHNSVGEDLLTIFIPSSPTPVTGYTITVRRDEVIDIPISIDQAIRFTVSGGVIVPFGQELSAREIEKVRHGVLPSPDRKEVSP